MDLSKKMILVTGASGQLGRAFYDYFKENGIESVLYTDIQPIEGRSEETILLDITNKEQVEKCINMFQPDIVINCAAYTAVDLCEEEEDKAYQINGIGPKNLAEAMNAINGEIVHVSTDYVYDGEASRPYIETDSTNPQNAYGRTKLVGDNFVQNSCEKYYIVRTAWVYGEGKNFVNTMLRLSENQDEVKVVSDQRGTPTSAEELAKMILKILELKEYGIYHGTCEGETTWDEFAREIFRVAGKSTRVIPILTKEYNAPAKRPMYSVLENGKLNQLTNYRMKEWQAALSDYMKKKGSYKL